jgi:hypothetical protein
MFYPSGQHLYAQYLEPSNFRKLSILPSFKNCTSFGDNYTEVVIYARNFYSKKKCQSLTVAATCWHEDVVIRGRVDAAEYSEVQAMADDSDGSDWVPVIAGRR